MNINITIVGGRLTSDPKVSQYGDGKTVVSGAIAVNKKKPNGEDEVLFLDYVFFDKAAASFVKFNKRGSTVLMRGRLTTDKWKADDGQMRTRTKLIGEQWEFGQAKVDAAPSFGTPAAGPTEDMDETPF